MDGLLHVLIIALCASTALAVQFPRQVTSQYTNSSTTRLPATTSASGAFCCQVYAPAAALNWWYTNATISAVQQTVVTQYLQYNNTVIPTATVTITDSSAPTFTGTYNPAAGGYGPTFDGIPTAMNAPLIGGQKYYQTIVQTGTEADFGYTTIAAPTPFIAFGYIYVFSGTVNSAGTCMGPRTATSTVTPAPLSAASEYNVYSEAMSWFRMAVGEPLGTVFDHDVKYTYFSLSSDYVSVVSTKAGEWYTDARATTLEEPFITWLAQDAQAVSAVPEIRSCSPVSGAGAPNVHVRVSFLTTSSAVTSTTNGVFLSGATTTSAVPASKTPTAGPEKTTLATTEIVPTPSAQPSEQPKPSPSTSAQPSDEPKPSPSTSSQPVSQEPASPSGGQTESPNTSKAPQEPSAKPNEPTSNQPSPTNPSTEPTEPPAIPSASADIPKTNPPEQTTADSGGPLPVSDNSPTSGIPQNTAGPSIATTAFPGEEPSQGSPYRQSEATRSDDPAVNLPAPTSAVSNEISKGSPSASGDTQKPANTGTGTTSVATSQDAPPVVIGELTATPAASSHGFVMGSQTLVPGSSAVEMSGTTYSSHTSGGSAVVNGQDVIVSTLASPPTQSPAPIVIGDVTGSPLTLGAYVIADQTLVAGGTAIEASGTTYSLKASGATAVVNGQEVPVSTLAHPAQSPVTMIMGSITARPLSSGAYILADQTLSRGGPAIEVSGTTYSLEPSGANVIVNGEPTPISALETLGDSPATVIIGSVTAMPESSGAYYVVAGQTLTPQGSAIEVAGNTYSLATSGGNIVINGASSYANAASTVSPILLGSATAVPFIGGGYIISSQILNPGGPAIEISGTTYSLPDSGNTVLVDGTPTAFETPAAVLTIGSQAYTAVAASVQPLVIASQTLYPGGAALTISGTTFSLAPSATGEIVINGQTTTLTPANSGRQILSLPSARVSFTPLSSGVVVASQTLYPGAAITVGGEILSLASGSAVIVGSGDTVTTEALGDYIWHGIATSTASGSGLMMTTTAVVSASRSTQTSALRSGDGTAATKSVGDSGTESAANAAVTTANHTHRTGARAGKCVLLLAVFVSVMVLI